MNEPITNRPSDMTCQRVTPAETILRWFQWLLQCGGLLLLAGCVGLMPVPSSSKQPEAGRVIARREASFTVGKTTRAEVVERLGPHYRESVRVPALAYSWELPGGTGLWWWFAVTPYAAGGNAGEFEWSHWRALFVGFDPQDRVAVTEFVRLSSGKSLDAQLERWAACRKLGPRPAGCSSGTAASSLAAAGGIQPVPSVCKTPKSGRQ